MNLKIRREILTHVVGRCDGKEDKCPSCLNLETQQQQLDKTIQYKQEEISELRNSIDRLNSQVSYHIFSNTQLQQEVDKLKNSTDVAPSQPVKRTGDGELEKLKKQLKDANDQNIILVNQISKGGKNEAALKQVTEALKKAQVDLAACQGELQQYKQNSVVTKNAAEIENKLRKQIEGEKATNKKLQKELDEALKAMKKAKSDLDKSGKDAGSANDELSKLKSRLKATLDSFHLMLKSFPCILICHVLRCVAGFGGTDQGVGGGQQEGDRHHWRKRQGHH